MKTASEFLPSLSRMPTMFPSLKSAIHWGSSKVTSSPVAVDQDDLCETCGLKQKFVENGFQHPYCSRTCARGGPSTKNPPSPSCGIPRCRAPASNAGFCSDVHAREAVRSGLALACAQCRLQPPTNGPLCSSCDRRNRAGSRLREIDPKGVTFNSIVTQLTKEWQGSCAPSVEKILEVSLPWSARSKFDAYRKKLDSVAYLRELRTYHAAQCICDMGVRDANLCGWKSCGICNIIRSSFKMFACGVKKNTGRYGEGVYSYLDPASADVHATSSISSPYRVMLACDVLIADQDDADQVDDGERVYVANADAIIPCYVILYKF